MKSKRLKKAIVIPMAIAAFVAICAVTFYAGATNADTVASTIFRN